MDLRRFQHTAARRRLGKPLPSLNNGDSVSTHSRPKAAGVRLLGHGRPPDSFNTQPPEGGWPPNRAPPAQSAGFNTQPPEGGWGSRPKAAGVAACAVVARAQRFQHTAARRRLDTAFGRLRFSGSFNTQPPEGGWGVVVAVGGHVRIGFNTQPPEGGWVCPPVC